MAAERNKNHVHRSCLNDAVHDETSMQLSLAHAHESKLVRQCGAYGLGPWSRVCLSLSAKSPVQNCQEIWT